MKSVTFVVEITTRINDNVDPEDVTFDIDLARVTPTDKGESVGHATGYTTTQCFEDKYV